MMIHFLCSFTYLVSKLFFLFAFQIFLISSKDEILEIPLTDYAMNIEVVSYRYTTSLHIDINAPYSIAEINFDDREEVMENQKEYVQYNNKTYIGFYVPREIMVKKKKFPFSYIYQDLFDYNKKEELVPSLLLLQRLTFALKPEKEIMSIVHQLYNTNQIKKKIFAIEYSKSINEGKMYIGGIPEEYKNKSIVGQCLSESDSWECSLKRLYFMSEDNKKVFDSDEKYKGYKVKLYSKNYINVPNDYYVYLINEVFGELIHRKICKGYNGVQLQCDNKKEEEVFKSLPQYLVLEFVDFSFRFQMKDLFRIDDIDITFLIHPVRSTEGNIFKIGMGFIDNLILFNYDTKTISFYSRTEIASSSYTKYILCLIILIVIIDSIILILSIKQI